MVLLLLSLVFCIKIIELMIVESHEAKFGFLKYIVPSICSREICHRPLSSWSGFYFEIKWMVSLAGVVESLRSKVDALLP